MRVLGILVLRLPEPQRQALLVASESRLPRFSVAYEPLPVSSEETYLRNTL